MAKDLNFAQSLVLTGFPGITAASYVIDEVTRTGDEQALDIIDDIQSDSNEHDYALGMITKGTVTISLYGSPALTIGATGWASITGCGFGLPTCGVVISKLPDEDLKSGERIKSSVTFQILPSGSRLMGGATPT